MNDQKFGGGSNEVAANAVRTARNAGGIPGAGAGQRADNLLPQAEFRNGSAGNFKNGLPGPAQNAHANGARPAGRVGPGWGGRK